MRLLVLLWLVVVVTFQTACERDAATAPQQEPLEPTAQVVAGSTVSSRIAFASCRNSCFGIFVMNADGSSLTELTRFEFDFDPSWSPDGRQITFTRWVAGELALADIFVMNADGSALAQLTDQPGLDEQASWSPDGRQIAFSSRRDGNSEIYLMNADGSGQTRLTNDPELDERPSWSPDGRQIAFQRGTFFTLPEVYVMGADGSSPTRLTSGSGSNPSWSPDGRRIAFQSWRDGNLDIYVMNADGSSPTRLTDNPADDSDPSWSPTGRIAFNSNRDGNGEIYVMADDGSGETRLTNHPRTDDAPSWGPWIDQRAPQLPPPVAYTEAAERWFGRVFVYSRPRATDDLDPNPDVACTPPAGSLFPIGTTRVDCTATDNAGNIGTGYFSVTIRGPYEELGRVSAQLEGVSSERLKDALTKTEAARADLAQTPPDRTAALGDLLGVVDNLGAARTAGELSASGYRDLVSQVTRVARLAADQSIAEGEARGGNAASIADAKDAFATGDARFSFGEYSDAVAQYRKACRAAMGA